jgi:hypothetical protein
VIQINRRTRNPTMPEVLGPEPLPTYEGSTPRNQTGDGPNPDPYADPAGQTRIGTVLPLKPRRPRQRRHARGSICDDCRMLSVYGAEPAWMSPEELCNYFDRVENHPNAEFKMTLGHLHDDPAVGCFHAGQPCETSDCDCERTDSASTACDLCGSSLAGDRHDVTFWKE